jgi:hypothetical protein
MKKYLLLVSVIFWLFSHGAFFHGQMPLIMKADARSIDYPDVPRVSAYEVYEKVRDGKAILIQAGGEDYKKRHIFGAFNLPFEQEKIESGAIVIPNFPRKGKEIFTYCY